MTSHSPEPWMILEPTSKSSLFRIIVDAGNFTITHEEGGLLAKDAKRIVACVNACKTISTENLKRLVADYGDPEITVPHDMAPFRPIQFTFHRKQGPTNA